MALITTHQRNSSQRKGTGRLRDVQKMSRSFGMPPARNNYLMNGTINATDLSTYVSCDRKVYLRHYGDRDKAVPDQPFDVWIQEQGVLFEEEVIARYKPVEPRYRAGDLNAGFEATLALMEAGHPYIYQGILIHDNVVGMPDLLERVDAPSRFGGYHYRPIDIKLASSAKVGHKLQVMTYIWLLENIQGVRPEGSLFLRIPIEERDQTEALYREEYVVFDVPEFHSKLAQVRELSHNRFEPLPFISSTCKSCKWREVCRPIAEKKQDASLIPGIPRKVWVELHQRNLGTLPAAARATREELMNINGVGEKRAHDIMLGSQALTTNKPIQFATPGLPRPSNSDIFFDIESVPTEGIFYLMGYLVPQRNGWAFEYDLANTPDKEERMWKSFLRRMDQLGGNIYHYGYYEKTAIKTLMNRYGDDPRAVALLERMIDLEKAIKDCIVLPLESYSLKAVAPMVGFSWTQNQFKADDSMLEYIYYQQDRKRSRMNAILKYNEDDCYATVAVRDWLLSLPRI